MQIVWISKAEIRPITGQNWFWIISKRDLDVKLDECSPQYFHKIQIFKDDKWWRFTIKETIYSSDSTDINLGRLGCLDEKIDLNDFRNEKRCGLAELGPRFTLRLRSLQKGTFDSKYGEFEFELRRKEMDSEGHGYSKKKFFLWNELKKFTNFLKEKLKIC